MRDEIKEVNKPLRAEEYHARNAPPYGRMSISQSMSQYGSRSKIPQLLDPHESIGVCLALELNVLLL